MRPNYYEYKKKNYSSCRMAGSSPGRKADFGGCVDFGLFRFYPHNSVDRGRTGPKLGEGRHSGGVFLQDYFCSSCLRSRGFSASLPSYKIGKVIHTGGQRIGKFPKAQKIAR